MKLITWISLCDFIANIVVLDGVPSDRDWCVVQAVFQQFFYPASWMWTVIMTYLLYCLVIDGKISMPEWQMHLISWGVATLCTVLPLTTSTYGVQVNDDDWCWIQPTSLTKKERDLSNLWEYLTFDVIIFGSFFLMMFWGILIFHRLRVQQIPTTQTVLSALRALLLYPIILFITWFPNAIVLTSGLETAAHTPRMIVINSLSIWQGGLTAIVFFRNSRESRGHWYNLFSLCLGACGCSPRKSEPRDTMAGYVPSTPTKSSSSIGTFINRLRGVDPDGEIQSHYSAQSMIEEDFESDDTYYGRTNDLGLSQSAASTLPTHTTNNTHSSGKTGSERESTSSIALSEFKNPIYRAR
jgi:hypothetical protein